MKILKYLNLLILFILLVNGLARASIIDAVFGKEKENEDYKFAVQMFENDPEIAADNFEKFISKYPNSKYLADCFLWCGVSYIYSEQYDSASVKLRVVEDSYKKYEDYNLCFYYLGTCYYNKGDYKTAISYFQKYTDSEFNNKNKKKINYNLIEKTRLGLARSYFNIGEYTLSSEFYNKYLETVESASARFALFKTYYKLGKTGECLKLSETIIKYISANSEEFTNKDVSRFYAYLGDIYLTLKKYQESLDYYNLSLKSDSLPADINHIYYNIAQCNYLQNKMDETIQALEQILALQNAEYKNEIYYMLALIYYNKSNFDSAAYFIGLSLKNFPDYNLKNAVRVAIEANFNIGNFAGVILTFENYSEPNGIKPPEILEKAAYSYFTLNKYDDVISLVSKMPLKRDSRYYYLKFLEAYSYFYKKNYYRTITELKTLLSVKQIPETLNYRILKLLADSYFEIQDYSSAESSYFQIVNIENKDIPSDEVTSKLGLCYLKQKKIDILEKLIELTFEQFKKSSYFQSLLFDYANSLKDVNKKDYFYSNIIHYAQDTYIINNCYFSLARIKFDQKRYMESLENLKKIFSSELTEERDYYTAMNFHMLKEYAKSYETLINMKHSSINTDKYYKLISLNLYNLKRFTEISAYSEKLSEKENKEKLFFAAAAAFYSGDYAKAVKNLELFVRESKSDEKINDAIYYSGVSSYNLNDYKKAKLMLLELENKQVDERLDFKKYLSAIYISEKNYPLALQYINAFEKDFFKKLSENDLNEIRYFKAKIYYFMQNYRASIDFISLISNPKKFRYSADCYLIKANAFQAMLDYGNANINYLIFIDIAAPEDYEKYDMLKYYLTIMSNFNKMEKYTELLKFAEIAERRFGLKVSPERRIEIVLSKSRALFQLQKFDETINYLNSQNIPDTDFIIEKNFRIASSFFNKKDFINANKYYYLLIENYSDNRYVIDVKLALAQSYQSIGDTGNYEKIQMDIITNVNDADLKIDVMSNLALHYFNNGAYDSAIHYFNRTAASSRANPQIIEKSYRYLALAYFKMRYYQKAIETSLYYLKTTDENLGNRSEINFTIAEAYFEIGNYQEALKRYAVIQPSNDFIEYKRCLSFYNLNQFDNVNAESKKFIAGHAKSAYFSDVKFMLGYSYFKIGDTDNAVKVFSDEFDKISNNDRRLAALNIIIDYYIGKNDRKYAAQWLKKKSELMNNKDFNTALQLGDMYFSSADWQNAFVYYSISIQHSQSETSRTKDSIYRNLMTCSENLKKFESALEYLELTDKKNIEENYLNKGRLLVENNNETKALKIYSEYIASIHSISKTGLVIVSNYLTVLEKSDKSAFIRDYKRIVDDKSIDDRASAAVFVLGLADVLYNEKDFPQALDYYWKALLKYNQKDIYDYIYFKIIQCYVNNGDLKKAKNEYEKFKKTYPKSEYINELIKINELNSTN